MAPISSKNSLPNGVIFRNIGISASFRFMREMLDAPIRGYEHGVDVDVAFASELNKNGYRWSGHTHPGIDINSLFASPGDYEILNCFDQDSSAVYNSYGRFERFFQRR